LVDLSPDDTLEDDEDEDESLMLKLFLDTLMKFAIAQPDSLTPYTQKMAIEMDELLAGVTVDEDT
jgi:antitoxin PrlF